MKTHPPLLNIKVGEVLVSFLAAGLACGEDQAGLVRVWACLAQFDQRLEM